MNNCIVGFFILLCFSGWAFAGQTPNVLTVHAQIGDFVDSLENSQYRIIGPLPGFAGAKFYRQGDRVVLHLFANADSGGSFWIRELTPEAFTNLTSKLTARISGPNKTDTLFLHRVNVDHLDPATDMSIFLRDGSMLRGSISHITGDTLNIETSGGIRVAIPDQNIERVEYIAGEIKAGGFYHADPNISRLLFSPTGHSLKAGTGYIADYYIFFPTLAFGITDYFTLSGGMSIIPGADSQLLYFAPKLSVPLAENINAGTGFLYMTIPDEDEYLALGYGVVTFGGMLSSLTLGAGVPLNHNANQVVVLVIGGEKQISNSVKLLSENWIFTGDEDSFTMLSGAVRFFGDRLAVDLALLTTFEAFDGDGFPFLPWVDFSYSFGH